MDLDEGYSAVKAILLSFYNAAVFAVRWTPVLVVILWIALLPLLWKLAKASERDFSHPVLVMAGVYCVISAMFTPTLYAVGMTGAYHGNDLLAWVFFPPGGAWRGHGGGFRLLFGAGRKRDECSMSASASGGMAAHGGQKHIHKYFRPAIRRKRGGTDLLPGVHGAP